MTVKNTNIRKQYLLGLGTAMVLSLAADTWAQISPTNRCEQTLSNNSSVPSLSTNTVWGK